MLIYKVLAFLFMIPGVVIVFAAPRIVELWKLDEKTEYELSYDMPEEEVKKYKYNRAMVNVKMLGLLVALPGFIFLIIGFR